MWQIRKKYNRETINPPTSPDKNEISYHIVVNENREIGHGPLTPLLHQHKTSCWGRVN